MMKDFFALLDNLNESDRKLVEGYSLCEIKKLEKLYDIAIKADFLEFMLKMGRCSGGLFGDVPIPLYRELWPLRTHIFFQTIVPNFLREQHLYDLSSKKPFCIAYESETQYYFILSEATEDWVYHYDENNDIVRNTNLIFKDFMMKKYIEYADEYVVNGNNIICRGELLFA